MQTNDKYRRDSLDGGTTWGEGYQFVGTDGKDGADGHDGSDATVPKYITDTVIAKGVIEAPRINANIFGVYPSNQSDTNGAFILHAPVAGQTPEVFKIAYNGTGGGAPTVIITGGPTVFWDVPVTEFDNSVRFGGTVDFSNAKDVKGIIAKFA